MSDPEPNSRPGPHRWQPGESGNPGGRPAGTQETATLVREALRRKTTPEKAEQLAETLLEGAIAGNAKLFSLYLRTHGMLTDNVNLAGSEVLWNWQPGGQQPPQDAAVPPQEAPGSTAGAEGEADDESREE